MIIFNFLEIIEYDGYFVGITKIGKIVLQQIENIDHSDQ